MVSDRIKKWNYSTWARIIQGDSKMVGGLNKNAVVNLGDEASGEKSIPWSPEGREFRANEWVRGGLSNIRARASAQKPRELPARKRLGIKRVTLRHPGNTRGELSIRPRDSKEIRINGLHPRSEGSSHPDARTHGTIVPIQWEETSKICKLGAFRSSSKRPGGGVIWGGQKKGSKTNTCSEHLHSSRSLAYEENLHRSCICAGDIGDRARAHLFSRIYWKVMAKGWERLSKKEE